MYYIVIRMPPRWRCQLLGPVLALLLGSISFNGARADELAAIVEDASPSVSAVGLFEYLSPGTKLRLASEDWLVLGYLRSCKQEHITGGDITIGEEESTVTGGSVKRQRVECDGGSLQLTAEQSERAGVTVMRKSDGVIESALTVYSLSPLFQIRDTAESLTLESIDRPQKIQNYKIHSNRVDLAEHSIRLRSGGLYRAKAAEHEIIFRVDKFARPGISTLLGRLIPL
jgi:hypothetical protein